MTLTVEDYELTIADHRRLTRELDVAMHGEEGAAPQASLCDLIDPARKLRALNSKLLAALETIAAYVSSPEPTLSTSDFEDALFEALAAANPEKWETGQ